MRWTPLRVLLSAVFAVMCLAAPLHAVSPSKSIAQYVHDKWDVEKGFLGGTVNAICQSQDGYLWIGTERGLVRFDGFNFTLIQRPLDRVPPIGAVRGLVADVEGNLWIRADGSRLWLYRNGRFEDAVKQFGLQEMAFTAMTLDAEGELLLWGVKSQTLRYKNGRFTRYANSANVAGIVISAAETRDHKVWLGTRDIGLFHIDGGRLSGMSSELSLTSINSLLAVGGDGLWIGTDTGLWVWKEHQLTRPSLPPSIRNLRIFAMTRDRDGNVWMGTAQGLVRISPGMAVADDLLHTETGSEITAVYEDRDGDIWYGGPHGIERLREGTFTQYTTAEGLPTEKNGPVFVDDEGRTWFAPLVGGLYWMKNGHVNRVAVAGLDKDVVYSISGGSGEIWVGREYGGLTRLTESGDTFSGKTYTQADGLAQNSVYSVHRNRDGTVWAGTVSGGISCLKDGRFTNYSIGNGPLSNATFSIVEGYDGTMWFASPSGLESFSQGRWKNYSVADGLPSSNIRSIFEDSGHVLWIATSGGLAYFDSGHVRMLSDLTDPLREEVIGMAEDQRGFLWIVTSDHVLRVNRDHLLAGVLTETDVVSYGPEDGLPGVEGVRRDRSVIADAKGRIWFSLSRGLASTDPAASIDTAIPVAVRIESIAAGDNQVSLAEAPEFPAGTQNITINFAGTNLSMPQKIRYRYKLDGADHDWSNVVSSRQVVYRNLTPGSYQFHVMASNEAGRWKGPETVLRFSIAPAFWQTAWFRMVALAMVLLIALAMYHLRMAHLKRQLGIRFSERLAERTRLAQELHDTLLQGVLSASLQLDLVEEKIASDSPVKPLLTRVLQLLRHVTEEGRKALRGLREPGSLGLDLENTLSQLGEEFASEEGASYRVIVHGERKTLRPAIRDEVYRIGREAVVNAFLHAGAQTIQVEVEYANKFFRLLVRDNGCGMEPGVLRAGRQGHWGLVGMRERAETMRASLRLWSRTGAGTEVELTIPGEDAFGSNAGRVSKVLPWLNREKFESVSSERKDHDSR